jgi:hypothetical protein
MGKLSAKLKKEVDLVVFNDLKSNILLANILIKGKLIYAQDPDFHFYYSNKKHHEAVDFLEHYRYVNR